LGFGFFVSNFNFKFGYIKKNKKMKHIKLFENFGKNPIIKATGDWSKLSLSGEPMEWIHANTYFVTYYTNPTPDMVELLQQSMMGEYFTIAPEQAADDILGGDQSGSYILRDEEVMFLADPAFSPEDYKNELQKLIDQFNSNPEGFERDQCMALIEDPELDLDLTPEFLRHCKALVSGSGMYMKPRISLVFKVV
jgi:hypothetical protein